jgi:hypothetical protein
MFYSDTLALRPNFGIAGRIFIDIASPYGIYRDTGSAWVQIAGSGGITGSGTLNTIAMFTPSGTAVGDSAITQTGSNVTVGARNLIVTNGAFTLSHTHNLVNGTFNPYGEQIAVTNTFNAGITWTALLACFNSSSLQTNLFNGSVTFGNGSYTTNNLNLSNITFNAAGSTITSTQASGGIRAYANQILQLRIDGTNNGTYTHYANSAVYGDFASSTARLTITNRYGYLVNNFDEYSASHTYTNRWAFYNAGINDNNFFAGKVGIGAGYIPSTWQLDVNGETFLRQTLLLGGEVFAAGSNFYLNGPIINTGAINLRFATAYLPNTIIGGTLSASDATIYNFINLTKNAGVLTFQISNTKVGGGTWFFENNRNAVDGSLEITKNTSTPCMTFFQSDNISIGSFVDTLSAQLSMTSTTKGFKPPSMTTTEKNAIASPVLGLIVFDTTLNKLCLYTTAWETVTSI